MTSSCYLCECVSLFACVSAQWPAQGVALPASKCMLGYAELTPNRSKNEKEIEWMNERWDASQQQSLRQSKAIKDILSKMHSRQFTYSREL